VSLDRWHYLIKLIVVLIIKARKPIKTRKPVIVRKPRKPKMVIKYVKAKLIKKDYKITKKAIK
jgi:hypothetical protein